MSSHYNRKTPMRSSELLRDAIAILEDTLQNLKEIRQIAKKKHQKPTVAPYNWFGACRAAQYMINTDKDNLTNREKKIAEALHQYCGPYERDFD